ncbi:MAG TPA: hypothetical protein VF508_14310, partial [Pyrinomonadaceae bacterium]
MAAIEREELTRADGSGARRGGGAGGSRLALVKAGADGRAAGARALPPAAGPATAASADEFEARA